MKKKHIQVDASKIRQHLRSCGYKWLRRSGKRLFSKEQKLARLRWTRAVLRLTDAELALEMGMSLDGVIIGIPPADPTERANHCRVGDTHHWRKKGEAALAKLQGGNDYGKRPIGPKSLCGPHIVWGLNAHGFQST